MSDIPLRSLRKSRAGYTPLNGDPNMPVNIITAAANSSRRSARSKGKRPERYADEDEEATLLGGGEQDGEYDDGFREDVAEPSSSHISSRHRPSSLLSKRSAKDKSRTVPFRPPDKLQSRFPPNTVRNQKYNAFTFLPIVFYEQFKFFFNLYFLLVALSQFVPALKIGICQLHRIIAFSNIGLGFILTYVAPLAFVLLVTMGKEAYDDYKRYLRDHEANSQKYLALEAPDQLHANDNGPYTRSVPSSSLRVGDLVHLEKNQRVPADLVLLRTSDASGTCFIRTDQLDGETDWKLRVAVPACQKLASEQELLALDAEIYADGPIKDINSFVGTFTINSPPLAPSSEDDVPMVPVPTVEPLTVENVLWSNTVLAAGSAVGFVVYTGSETRAVMNTSHPETKVGLLDLEINRLAKVNIRNSDTVQLSGILICL